MDGRTSVTGLYAVGEAASTGVHGANRLASNSLTEALITGRRAGDLLGRDLPEPSARLRLPPAGPGVNPAARPVPGRGHVPARRGAARSARAWNASGRCWSRTPPPGTGLDLATVEATNLHAVSVLVTVAALARTESRGCHRWRDAPPVISAERARHTVVRVTTGQPSAAGAVRARAGASA